ncbi:Eukaryotic translation initiation factor 3 subunit [Hortaea werneckii]|uniref:Eukaryotic translation initiation factor 3 subunit A n=2 Tax=Hortaea werneckii TaxID=91943 RepID=A0A3M7FTH7_HORWE|nr:Eukaryotic translation initiation factor 3 subunit [Hortaea werneckii]OTA36524.1 Eukaryotic translation initiation factor 3 subunit A [Hortaea werneckii EXF-2000]KAI6889666.1 Eukaryotic translation initiation factor 3 subunit [Hortaea werneckii]KAI7001724.1 Eukaryotic translation initiation factor 3 subunit [Hortaea werneckii]KAI7095620.1 Eukaryotic translation initiation factor 3 subunit [Hortaea werneckii]
MPPPPHIKPENVLKRAQELIGVNQQQAALSVLHEHVTSKRTRNSTIASLEPVMLLFVELCVDLRKGKSAKDGLYNYKNTSQNTNVATIELVFRRFIELAEQKVKEAQSKADEVSGAGETKEGEEAGLKDVGDLEAIETPESILLSTVSGEQSKDRTDRAIVTPWLKFLWETYRTVLDIFKNNARLEVMYQTTAHQAFDFCKRYTRKTEFRRLCELLRNHLQNAAKYSQQVHAINLSDPETLQRHLDTRFEQLNVAVELELWQEAFKSVEDIHTLLSLSKRQPKNSMMATYFERLTRIFLVSENYLFHAAAWSRYYNLLSLASRSVAAGASKKDNPTNISDADLSKAASFVLLSALAIPVISTTRSRGALVDVDAARNSKNARLTNLLGMNTPPSRSILFKDLSNKDILQRARPEIRSLYNILETDFHPKSICEKVSPVLSQIGADEELRKYVVPLQQVILTRLFQQLSQVYTDVKLEDVLALAKFPDPFQVSASTIEKFIMNGCKKGDLSIRIDHSTGILTFDQDVFSSSKALHPGSAAGSAEADGSSVQRLQSTPSEIVRTQLSRLSKALYLAVQYVDPSFNEDRQKLKLAALKRAEAGAEKEHMELVSRRDTIQKKKESVASAQAARQREEEQKRKLKQQELQAAETERLAQEAKDRDERRIQAERKRVQREETEKQLKELKRGVKGVDISGIDIDELDSGRIRLLKLQALEREKNEMSDKLKTTGKRIDHLERAYRREEIKHLGEDYAAQREKDQKSYEAFKNETLQTAEQKHKEDVEIKHRLSRLVPTYESFKKTITNQRHADFEKRRRAAERELEQKMEQRRRDVREQKAAERRRAQEEERFRREEEERAAREAEEAERAAEEKKQKDAEAKAEAESRRQERAEAARKQMEREAEAERKMKERKMGGGAPSAAPARSFEGMRRGPAEEAAPAPSAGGPPRLALQGQSGKPSWREREAMRQSGQLPAESAAPPAAPAADARVATEEASMPKKSGYIPPALRGNASGAGESMPSEPPKERSASDRWGPRRPAEGERSESPAGASGGAYRPPGSRGAAGGASGGAYRPPGRR